MRELICALDCRPIADYAKIRCPCGWPKQSCEKHWAKLRDPKPEVGPEGSRFDGETWAS